MAGSRLLVKPANFKLLKICKLLSGTVMKETLKTNLITKYVLAINETAWISRFVRYSIFWTIFSYNLTFMRIGKHETEDCVTFIHFNYLEIRSLSFCTSGSNKVVCSSDRKLCFFTFPWMPLQMFRWWCYSCEKVWIGIGFVRSTMLCLIAGNSPIEVINQRTQFNSATVDKFSFCNNVQFSFSFVQNATQCTSILVHWIK